MKAWMEFYFSGSNEVGTRIKQDTLQQSWKFLALQMGGRNAAIVWEDADLESAVQKVLVGAFLTAGQRCTSTSRVIVHQSLFSKFIEKFHLAAKSFVIGPPSVGSGKQPFMGPLIDQGSVDRYLKFQGIAVREGAEQIMRGKVLELRQSGNYVTPSIFKAKDSSVEAARKSVYQQTETLSPGVILLETNDLDHAFALANATSYGNCASVFTQNKDILSRAVEQLAVGTVLANRPTTDESADLSRVGLKKSGNHVVLGASAVRSYSLPVATLLRGESDESDYPGLR